MGDHFILSKELTRRDLVGNLALALSSAAVPISLEAAQHVHEAAAREKEAQGAYTPKCFNPHEFRTLERLAELIIPADGVTGSAREAGAPEFIDLLCSQNPELAAIFTGGLLWLDAEMRRRHGAPFVEAGEREQIAVLEGLWEASGGTEESKPEPAAGGRDRPDTSLSPGVVFFNWVTKLTVDAFYTSRLGIKDLGYTGNSSHSKYVVPQEVIDYAIKRSPFAGG